MFDKSWGKCWYPWDGGPLIINPHIHLKNHVGIYWGPYPLFKGLQQGGLNNTWAHGIGCWLENPRFDAFPIKKGWGNPASHVSLLEGIPKITEIRRFSYTLSSFCSHRISNFWGPEKGLGWFPKCFVVNVRPCNVWI